MKTTALSVFPLLIGCLTLSGCASSTHGSDYNQISCANIKQALTDYYRDPKKIQIVGIDKNSRELNHDYQTLHCTSLGDYLGQNSR